MNWALANSYGLAVPTLPQRWGLARALHQQGLVALEGTFAQLILLVVATVRSGWPPFALLALLSLVSLPLRLWDHRRFLRAHEAFRATQDDPRYGTPEGWTIRHAAGVVFLACIWGTTDLCVLIRFDDGWLQIVTLLIQTGWIASTCFRFACFPRLVTLLLCLTIGSSLFGITVTAERGMRVLFPVGLLHFISLRRTARAQAEVITSLLRAEHEAAAANDQLRRLSLTDGLTGIANRRCFDETIATEWRRAARDRSSLALLMIDVDHFKRYNDHYGHQAGDECLRRAAQTLVISARRPGDLVARYGGEEFAMILPATETAEAHHIAERVRDGLARNAMPHVGSAFGTVTVSIGIASVRVGSEMRGDANALIRAADAGLYRAKRSGRNRSCRGNDALAAATGAGAVT